MRAVGALLAASAAAFVLAACAPQPEPRSRLLVDAAASNGSFDLVVAEAGDIEARRAGMVSQIFAEVHDAADWTGREELDPRVMAAFAEVPRHRFVPEPLAPLAYLNRPLPVGHGQTVSQPFITALMVEFAEIEPGDKVLLIGIGGGYEAAILATVGAEVQAVELQRPVAEAAMARLAGLGYADRVAATVTDGYFGAPAQGPYDAIVVRQAVDHFPDPLLAQLAPGGRLVIPKGGADARQMLTVVEMGAEGRWRQRGILPVRFTYMPGGRRI